MSNVLSEDSLPQVENQYLFKDDYTAALPLSAWENGIAIRTAPKKELNPAWLTRNEFTFLAILNLHDSGNGIFASYPTLKRETGINSDATLAYLIKCLEIKGWLIYLPGKFKGNASEYKILIPAEVQRVMMKHGNGSSYVGKFIFPERLPERFNSLPVRNKPKKGTTSLKEADHFPEGSSTTSLKEVQVNTGKRILQDTTVPRSAQNQSANLSSQNKDFDLPAIGATLPVLGTENVEEVDRGSSLSGFACSEEIPPTTSLREVVTKRLLPKPLNYYERENKMIDKALSYRTDYTDDLEDD